jgi:hypothetical protein
MYEAWGQLKRCKIMKSAMRHNAYVSFEQVYQPSLKLSMHNEEIAGCAKCVIGAIFLIVELKAKSRKQKVAGTIGLAWMYGLENTRSHKTNIWQNYR